MKRVNIREKDLATLRGIFRSLPHVREVRLFGSRATGHAGRASDIDLAISAPEASAADWQALKEALDQAPIVFEFDVVRTEQNVNPRLLEKITREGVPIYPEVYSALNSTGAPEKEDCATRSPSP